MLEWQEQGGEGPYPPPQRACLVCGRQQWFWNGERYECGSGDPAHTERAGWAWIYAGEPFKEGVRNVDQEYVTIRYKKLAGGVCACVVNSNISLERGRDFFDMKVYLSGERVYEQFTASAGGAIHIDVYSNNGEGPVMRGDLQVTEQAIVVTSFEGGLRLQAIEEGS